MTSQDEAFSHLPKYFRIQQELLGKIRNSIWRPGSSIPSEAELCAAYAVSRGTVRRALDDLQRQGLILRSPGRPTTVNAPKIPLLASGFRTDIANKGMRPGTQVLTIQTAQATPEIAQHLEIPVGTPVLVIERVISADDIPIIIESAHVARVADPISPEEVETTSLLDLIPAKCHAYLMRAVESYEPILLTHDQARLLDCQPGQLGIKDQAVVYDGEDRPLYLSCAIVRGDKARIVTETSFPVHS